MTSYNLNLKIKTLAHFVFLWLLALSCKQANNNVVLNHVELSIEQDDNIIEPIDGTFYLDKSAFNLVFKCTSPNFILVNASYNNDLMFKALNNESLVTQAQFADGNIIAEPYFNPEKSLYTSNESSSAWLQESKDEHMFNALEIHNGNYTGTRIIENSFDLDENVNTKIDHINRPLYLVFVVIDKNSALKNNIELQRIAIKIDWLDADEATQSDSLSAIFNQLIDSMPLKNTPLSDDTNFDNTALTMLLTKEEANVLQLGKIYPNFFTEGYSFKVSPSYRIDVYDSIITLVFNVAKGDYELETILVNYNQDGQFIDHKIIAYDEIAEGMHKISSSIDANIISTTHYWIDEEEDVTQRFIIEEDGQIRPIEIIDAAF